MRWSSYFSIIVLADFVKHRYRAIPGFLAQCEQIFHQSHQRLRGHAYVRAQFRGHCLLVGSGVCVYTNLNLRADRNTVITTTGILENMLTTIVVLSIRHL